MGTKSANNNRNRAQKSSCKENSLFHQKNPLASKYGIKSQSKPLPKKNKNRIKAIVQPFSLISFFKPFSLYILIYSLYHISFIVYETSKIKKRRIKKGLNKPLFYQ